MIQTDNGYIIFFYLHFYIYHYRPQITPLKSCCCCPSKIYLKIRVLFFLLSVCSFTVSSLYLNLHLRFQFDPLRFEDFLLDFLKGHCSNLPPLELIFKSDGVLIFFLSWQVWRWRSIWFGVCDDLVGDYARHSSRVSWTLFVCSLSLLPSHLIIKSLKLYSFFF